MTARAGALKLRPTLAPGWEGYLREQIGEARSNTSPGDVREWDGLGIRETASHRTLVLEAEHIVGRARTSALCINEQSVSAQHAILRFSGGRWAVRELGTRNGTFLNAERLKPGAEVTLRVAEFSN